MFRVVGAKRLQALERELAERREQGIRLECAILRLRSEKDLIQQARQHAEELLTYWRTRAERFLDQIGASSGIISAPTMTDPAPAPTDDVRSVFAAVGRSEINTGPRDLPTSAAASTAAAPVVGVDPVVAQRAINEALRGVGSA